MGYGAGIQPGYGAGRGVGYGAGAPSRQGGYGAGYFAGATPLTILGSSLIAYWTLNEASGTRLDSQTNALNLTDNNTVTQAAGRVGNAAQFTAANSESLSHVDDALLRMGAVDFTIAFWVYPDDVTGFHGFVTKSDGTNTGTEYEIRSNDAAVEVVMTDGVLAETASKAAALSIGVWAFILVEYVTATGVLSISVNNGTAGTANIAAPITGTNSFRIGSRPTDLYHNGRLDEVGIWKRVLTANEKAWIYAYGGGT